PTGGEQQGDPVESPPGAPGTRDAVRLQQIEPDLGQIACLRKRPGGASQERGGAAEAADGQGTCGIENDGRADHGRSRHAGSATCQPRWSSLRASDVNTPGIFLPPLRGFLWSTSGAIP